MSFPSDISGLSSDQLLAVLQIQTEVVQADMDLGKRMDLIADRAQAITQADGAVIELCDGEEMVYRAVTGIAKGQLGLRINRQGSLSGLCIEAAKPLQCDDSETDPRVDLEACRRVGLRSMIVVPLLFEGQPVGVLKVLSAQAAKFGLAELRLLDLMADFIGASMSHTSQYEASLVEAEALMARATQDSLTGLGNRSLFYDRLRQLLSLARRQNQRLAVALLDMDGLKYLNDNFGHKAGDAALKLLGDRLKTSTRASDVVARLGGDEFGIVLAGLTEKLAPATFATKLWETIEGPFRFENHEFHLKASIGVALYDEDGEEINALVDTADARMYESKRQRKAQSPLAG